MIESGGNSFESNNIPRLRTFRRELRSNLTPAEATLWKLLKNRQLDGRKFRRQHSFGSYILDFFCPAERLAIELDGQGHNEFEQCEYDRERDIFLKCTGIKVLRFENRLVFENAEGVLQDIRACFDVKQTTPSSDVKASEFTPPCKGGEL